MTNLDDKKVTGNLANIIRMLNEALEEQGYEISGPNDYGYVTLVIGDQSSFKAAKAKWEAEWAERFERNPRLAGSRAKNEDMCRQQLSAYRDYGCTGKIFDYSISSNIYGWTCGSHFRSNVCGGRFAETARGATLEECIAHGLKQSAVGNQTLQLTLRVGDKPGEVLTDEILAGIGMDRDGNRVARSNSQVDFLEALGV